MSINYIILSTYSTSRSAASNIPVLSSPPSSFTFSVLFALIPPLHDRLWRSQMLRRKQRPKALVVHKPPHTPGCCELRLSFCNSGDPGLPVGRIGVGRFLSFCPRGVTGRASCVPDFAILFANRSWSFSASACFFSATAAAVAAVAALVVAASSRAGE